MAEQSAEQALLAVGIAMSQAAAGLRRTVRVLEEGWVLSVGDGVPRVDGLPIARGDEGPAVGGDRWEGVPGLPPPPMRCWPPAATAGR